MTSSLFLEAGFSNNTEYYTNSYQDGVGKPRGSAEWYAGAARNELDLGGYKTAAPLPLTESPKANYWNVAATYVTGAHTIKFGANRRWGIYTHTRDANADLTQQYRSSSTGVRWSVPDSVLIRNTPLSLGEKLDNDLGIYIQDSWRLNRLTANVGIRYEMLSSSVMAGESPAGRFVGARTFPEIANVPNWKDWAPRMALVYDVFGNGKTAIKAALGRYTPLAFTASNNPASNASASTTRTWDDANKNFVPDCDLRNPQVNGECGVWSDLSFGGVRPGTFWTDSAIKGFNTQQYNWQGSLSLQHELRPGTALNVGYYRTWYGNFLITDNEALSAAPSPSTSVKTWTSRPSGVFPNGSAVGAAAKLAEEKTNRARLNRVEEYFAIIGKVLILLVCVSIGGFSLSPPTRVEKPPSARRSTRAWRRRRGTTCRAGVLAER